MLMHFIRLWVTPQKTLCNAQREERQKKVIWGKIVDIYDGDTFTICYIRDGKLVRRRCRCEGYDSPELRTKDVREKEAALRAKDFLQSHLPSGVSRFQINGLDKFGRLLVSYTKNGKSLADVMIENGHGYAYAGGTKQKFARS
jgi:endonuclease YncB( thermonuclease family)